MSPERVIGATLMPALMASGVPSQSAGKTILNSVRPGRLLTSIVPPCRSTIALAIDNPRPLPADPFVRAASTL